VVGNSNRFGTDPTGTETLTVLDTSANANGGLLVVGSIAAGAFPRSLVMSQDGKILLLANFGSSSLQILDARRLPINTVSTQ
jgi:hypothetical protein